MGDVSSTKNQEHHADVERPEASEIKTDIPPADRSMEPMSMNSSYVNMRGSLKTEICVDVDVGGRSIRLVEIL